jgi:hypothetical protein
MEKTMRHQRTASAVMARAGFARRSTAPGRSFGTPWSRRSAAAAVALLGPLACGTHAQQVDAFWNSAVSGDWLDASRWSTDPFAPDNDNQPGVTYRAFLNAEGSPYSISLFDDDPLDIHLDELTISSSSATLAHGSGILTVPVVNLSAGTYSLSGGTLRDATVNLSGGTFAIPYNTANKLDNVTINGSLSLGFTYATVENGLAVNGGVTLTGDGTLGFVGGPQTVTSGTFTGGRLSIGGGSTVTFGPATEVHVGSTTTTIGFKTENESEGDNQFINQGLITASGADRYLNIMPNLFTNEGTIEVTSGARLAAGVTQNGLETQWTNNGILRIDDGTLSLGGRFSFGPQGSIQRTGGKISLVGVWNNSDALDVNTTTGSINMDGGAINGGVVNLLDGEGLVFDTGDFTGAGTGGLYGVTLNGDMELSDKGATLGVRDGLTLNGTVNITGEGARVYLQNDQTIRGGTFVFDTTSGTIPSMGSGENTTLTLDPDVVIRGRRGGFGGLEGSTFVNQGLISADLVGQPLVASGWIFENEGIIEAKDGGKMNISANAQFRNSGVIRVGEGSTLTIGKNFRQTGGTIEQTGGLIVVQGDVDNTGLSMNLTQPTDIWSLDNGIIAGGELNITADARLGTAPNSLGQLDGVAINGTMIFDGSSGGLGLRGGLELDGSVVMVGGRSITSMDTQTFSGDGEIVMRGNGDNGGNVKQELILKNGSTLTIAPGFTIRGGTENNRAWIGRPDGGTAHLINQGLISAELPANGIAIKSLTFANEGVIEARNGSTLEITEAYWTNSGTIRAVDGGGVFLNGVYSTASLTGLEATSGTIGLRGDLDNTASTFVIDDQMTGLRLMDARIRGGTIQVDPGGQFVAFNGASVLDGVAVSGDMILGDGGRVQVSNGLSITGMARLIGQGSSLRFKGDQVFDGMISFEGQAGEQSIMGINNSTVTLGSNAYVRGGRGIIFTNDLSSVVNQGLISADVADQAITIYLARFANEGTLEAINGGELILIPPDSPDPMLLLNHGELAVGAGSRLSFEGEFVQSPSGVMGVTLGGKENGQFGQISLAGTVDLDGGFRLSLGNGYWPVLGDHWTVLSLGARTGKFSEFDLPGLDVGLHWDVRGLYSQGTVAVIPAPGAWPLLAGALITAARSRRPSRRAGVRS